MENQKLTKQQNSTVKTAKGKKQKAKKKFEREEQPIYFAFLLVNLLPTIASLLQTGQITMAVAVAQGLASCVLIIKMAIDRK